MSTIHVTINGIECPLDASPKALLLDVLRDDLRLAGTRFGCGAGRCGVCHVLVEGCSRSRMRSPPRHPHHGSSLAARHLACLD
jgi:aerobic-type carbon monoxide dehydrogenase small subunit (CoxS/CutS family)